MEDTPLARAVRAWLGGAPMATAAELEGIDLKELEWPVRKAHRHLAKENGRLQRECVRLRTMLSALGRLPDPGAGGLAVLVETVSTMEGPQIVVCSATSDERLLVGTLRQELLDVLSAADKILGTGAQRVDSGGEVGVPNEGVPPLPPSYPEHPAVLRGPGRVVELRPVRDEKGVESDDRTEAEVVVVLRVPVEDARRAPFNARVRVAVEAFHAAEGPASF